MHFDFIFLKQQEFHILGLKTNNKHSCYTYAKYNDSNSSVIIFSTIRYNTLDVYFLKKEGYEKFKNNLAYLQSDRFYSDNYELMESFHKVIFKGGNITRKAKLLDYLKEAENFCEKNILIRGKLVAI